MQNDAPDSSARQTRSRAWARRGLSLLCLALGAGWLAPRYCALGWDAHYRGELARVRAQGEGAARWVEADLDASAFATGSARFDGEWWFGTYLMAGLGYVQSAREHEALRARHLELAHRCVERLLDRRVRGFDTAAWREDPIDSLAGEQGHAAYLGYLNLLLGLLRELDPTTPTAELHDRISAACSRRLAQSPTGLLETYPGERYPVDNAALVASLWVHARVHGQQPQPHVVGWSALVRARYLDPATGLLIQAVGPTGAPIDAPRGSGTGLAALFLAHADPALSRELYQALRAHLADRLLGFGVVREYPASVPGGRGDIDSGPLIFGYSVSATGFTLGASRVHGDPESFARLYATAWLFGAPVEGSDGLRFAAGGPLGDALLFALLTAPRLEAP